MCDYSLMAIPNRLAREGEELVVHRFPTGSLGLACATDVNCSAESTSAQARTFWTTVKELFSTPESRSTPAVCIPPGARLMLHDIPARLQNELCISSDENVTFTQITASVNSYRDAVRFSSGREVRLQELQEGQRVEVLDLAMAEGFKPSVSELSEVLFRR
jgi:hypothetical protein